MAYAIWHGANPSSASTSVYRVARSKKQEARGKKQEARSKKQEARSKKQEARGKRQEARGKRQEARGKRQEARSKKRGASSASYGRTVLLLRNYCGEDHWGHSRRQYRQSVPAIDGVSETQVAQIWTPSLAQDSPYGPSQPRVPARMPVGSPQCGGQIPESVGHYVLASVAS